jgi:hypothetical protein
MNELTTEQLDVVEEGEPLLGLEKGFCRKLLTEDDWSFVIKTHALIESALTRLIEITVHPRLLGEFVTTFDLSGGRHSKVELLSRCDLIEDPEAKFVRGLSKIRNRLVHNVRHTSCDLFKFVSGHLSENEKDDFVKNTCCLFTEGKDLTRGSEIRTDVLKTPKPYIWLSALHVTAMATSRTQIAEGRAKNAVAGAKIDELERKRLELEVESLKKLLAATDSFFLPSKVSGLSLYKALLSEKGEAQSQTPTEQKTGEK